MFYVKRGQIAVFKKCWIGRSDSTKLTKSKRFPFHNAPSSKRSVLPQDWKKLASAITYPSNGLEVFKAVEHIRNLFASGSGLG